MILTTNELRNIESMLAERLKIDYTNFNDSFFRRRLTYMFEKMHFRRVSDLQNALSSLLKFDEITYYLAVPGTELFRTPSFWRILRKQFTTNSNLKKIWIPCLSSYHELYSLVITLSMAERTDYEIVVNVVSDKIAEHVRSLKLTKKDDQQDRSNFERLESSSQYEEYINMTNEGPFLKPELLNKVTFRNGWFMNEMDSDKFDVIIFRNALLGYNIKLHRQAVDKLVDMLNGTGSMLCLGAMEKPRTADDKLSTALACDSIYLRR